MLHPLTSVFGLSFMGKNKKKTIFTFFFNFCFLRLFNHRLVNLEFLLYCAMPLRLEPCISLLLLN